MAKCQKVRYQTVADAGNHLESIKSRDHPSRWKRLNVYKCHLCNAWHVGHIPPARYKLLMQQFNAVALRTGAKPFR